MTANRSDAGLTNDQRASLRSAMLELVFAAWDKAYLESEQGLRDITHIAYDRFLECDRHVVPWVGRRIDLTKARVVEIGCGSGSSTSAFARHAKSIHGYDIDANAVAAAERRAAILGQSNVRCSTVAAESLLTSVRADHPDASADVVLLYAVLEHQTLDERLATIRTSWDLLRNDGLMVVVETPNRLHYHDAHTSLLPFFHMLPHDLALKYADRSPRADFVRSLRDASAAGPTAAEDSLTRWGRGVSFHEFELALGNLESLVVGDGFDPEILALRPVDLGERLLYTWWMATGINQPVGFVRQDLNLILRKSAGVPKANAHRQIPIRPFTMSIRDRMRQWLR